MFRHASLVEKALAVSEDLPASWKVERLKLTMPDRWLKWVPEGVKTWLTHFWLNLTGPARIKSSGASLIHFLDGSYGYLAIDSKGMPAIATVHDLIPLLRQRGKFGPAKGHLLASSLIQKSIAGLMLCNRLVAVSESTAADLLELTPVENENVSVVPNALDQVFLDESKRQVKLSPAGTQLQPYIFHVGNNGYYKNREGVVRIFARVKREQNIRLVMAGPAPTAQLLLLVRELGMQDFVDFRNISTDDDLVELYRNASLFLFPSLYEGFGWPPLEAMACGCPVVCSSVASLPEMTGGAAMMAAPDDEEGLARLCLDVLKNPDKAASLRDKGKNWASQFTPERMGRQLVSVYKSALNMSENAETANAEDTTR